MIVTPPSDSNPSNGGKTPEEDPSKHGVKDDGGESQGQVKDNSGSDDGKSGANGVKVLPKTGEASHLPLQLAGAALIGLGMALRLKHRRKKA